MHILKDDWQTCCLALLLEVHSEGGTTLTAAKEVGVRGRILEKRAGWGSGTDLFAEGLVHLREQGELHEGHAAQSEEERDLGHSLVHGDQVVP